jgi:hypothetical protein
MPKLRMACEKLSQMTESLDERLAALVRNNTDTFRLTIRAHALIDEKLDGLLSYAFVAERPSFLRGPSFQRKVDLCVALGLMSPAFANLINHFTKLRNEIAHGADEVSAERAKLIFSVAHEFQPSLADLSDVFPRSEEPHDLLEASLVVIWAVLVGCEAVAAKRRDETLEALEAKWAEAAELGVMLFQADLRFRTKIGLLAGIRRVVPRRCQERHLRVRECSGIPRAGAASSLSTRRR